MRLYKGSRLRNINTGVIVDSAGELNRVFSMARTTYVQPKTSSIYYTKAGDTFESIAYREYGNANKWYVIANVNPNIFWPLDLVPGTGIYIPPRTYAEMS